MGGGYHCLEEGWLDLESGRWLLTERDRLVAVRMPRNSCPVARKVEVIKDIAKIQGAQKDSERVPKDSDRPRV